MSLFVHAVSCPVRFTTKIFLTFNLIQLLGRNFDKLGVVIHAAALVFREISLYFAEFKKGDDQIKINKKIIFRAILNEFNFKV